MLPSHACLRCHDIRTGTKPVAFSPIPQLAFDPFDVTARDAWLKGADRKQKAEVLGRMLKRLGTDKDMPPEDSTEAELYRVKDPTAINAVRDWLDAELKKVKVTTAVSIGRVGGPLTFVPKWFAKHGTGATPTHPPETPPAMTPLAGASRFRTICVTAV